MSGIRRDRDKPAQDATNLGIKNRKREVVIARMNEGVTTTRILRTDIPMTVVGSPGYFGNHPTPTPKTRLVDYKVVNLRLPT